MIRGELDWINFLYQGGAGVSQPFPTLEGEWVGCLDDGSGGSFLVSAYQKAAGAPHRGQEWPTPLLREYGIQLGRMHQLTQNYRPSHPAWKRPAWDDPVHLEIVNFIPTNEEGIQDLFWENIESIRKLPRDDHSYGLIHQDPHQGNFFVDPTGRITFFDFDDSSYSWFVEDIALAIFYASLGQRDPEGFTAVFLENFLPGYFSSYALDPSWFSHIPLFLKRREIDLYAVIHRSFDVEHLSDPWAAWYLDGRKERLLGRVPVLAFDFAGFDYQAFR
jgi:Ser/Thr protein kinase RdoA (MazF antagonist)